MHSEFCPSTIVVFLRKIRLYSNSIYGCFLARVGQNMTGALLRGSLIMKLIQVLMGKGLHLYLVKEYTKHFFRSAGFSQICNEGNVYRSYQLLYKRGLLSKSKELVFNYLETFSLI